MEEEEEWQTEGGGVGEPIIIIDGEKNKTDLILYDYSGEGRTETERDMWVGDTTTTTTAESDFRRS